MNRFDFVANKIAYVQREDPSNSVHFHHRNELCVMNLAAKDVVGDHKALPFFVHGMRIRKEFQIPFDFFNLGHRHRGRRR